LTAGNIEISIVIATFDRPQALARCLDSLVAQRIARRFEIVVVDNHPQSGLTTPLRARYPVVRWLEEPVAGLSRARNLAITAITGIAAGTGAAIVTTDDDVVAPPEWLERLTDGLFSGPADLAAVTGNCLALRTATAAENIFEAYGGLHHGDLATEFDAAWLAGWRIWFPQLWRIGTTANAAFRTSVFRDSRVGLFETRLGAGSPAGAWEDLYCFYRVLRAGYRIRYIPDAQLAHAHREDMAGLTRQLCAYRRGETAFLALVLTRHRDWRAIGQAFVWIPLWRSRVLANEILRRIRGRRRFPLGLLWRESLAYFAGPLALWRGRKHPTI
jgi:O-antigen biosynthesis protein